MGGCEWMQVSGSALLLRMVDSHKALCVRLAWDWAPHGMEETVLQQLEAKLLWVAVTKRFRETTHLWLGPTLRYIKEVTKS